MLVSGDTAGRPIWATWANLVTVLRLVLVVPTVVLIGTRSEPVWAFVLLVAFGVSDWVDGILARRLGQTSQLGALLDPIADRIGVVLIVLAFVVSGQLPVWLVLVVAGTDIALLAVYLWRRPQQTPRVTWLGKLRSAVLMSGIALLGISLLPVPSLVGLVAIVVCAIGAALHVGAGADYVREITAAAD